MGEDDRRRGPHPAAAWMMEAVKPEHAIWPGDGVPLRMLDSADHPGPGGKYTGRAPADGGAVVHAGDKLYP